MGPQCPCPNSGLCDYVTLHSKRDFAEVAKLRILRWEIVLDYLCGPNVITVFLKEGSRRDRVREADMMAEAKFKERDLKMVCSED